MGRPHSVRDSRSLRWCALTPPYPSLLFLALLFHVYNDDDDDDVDDDERYLALHIVVRIQLQPQSAGRKQMTCIPETHEKNTNNYGAQ